MIRADFRVPEAERVPLFADLGDIQYQIEINALMALAEKL
jgi:hypothetical protein